MTTQADALRAAADLLDAHPELPAPYMTFSDTEASVFWFLHSRGWDGDWQRETAAQIVAAIPADWTPDAPTNSGWVAREATYGPLTLVVTTAPDSVPPTLVGRGIDALTGA